MINRFKTVLIVDSDKDMCWLLKKMLEAKNCHIMASDTRENILHLISQTKPDLVLMDVPLNNISSAELLRYIRDFQPNTPMIVISPYVNGGLVSKMRELGNCEFITKPFVIQNLIMTVRQRLCLAGD